MRPIRIAVFDLDHTLTRHDTFLLYLLGFLVRHPWRFLRCVHLPLLVIFFYSGRLCNSQLKERFLEAVLYGVHRVTLEAWTKRFVGRLIHNGIFPEALSVLEQHRRAGDVLVLLTASLDCYVLELGHLLKFDEVICTKVKWERERLSGRFSGPNIYGKEKVRCLLEVKARFADCYITAYADSYSDIPLLLLADRGVLVNGRPKTRALAAREGLFCHTWKD